MGHVADTVNFIWEVEAQERLIANCDDSQPVGYITVATLGEYLTEAKKRLQFYTERLDEAERVLAMLKADYQAAQENAATLARQVVELTRRLGATPAPETLTIARGGGDATEEVHVDANDERGR